MNRSAFAVETLARFADGTAMGDATTFHRATSVSIRELDVDPPIIDQCKIPSPDATTPKPIVSHTGPSLSNKPTPSRASIQKKICQPNPSPRSVLFGYKLFYLSAIITFIGLVSKTANLVSDLDIGHFIETKLENGLSSFATGIYDFKINLRGCCQRSN